MIDKIENTLLKYESKFGLFKFSILTGFLLFILACIYVTPSLEAHSMGCGYMQISNNPFDFNFVTIAEEWFPTLKLQFRILTPLIAYLLFLRNDLYIIVPMLFGISLLIALYMYFRKNNFDIIESVLGVSTIAFSSTLLFTLHYQGFVDMTSYFLIFLAFVFIIKEKKIAYLFYALSLFNHESNLFFAPVILWLSIKNWNMRTILKSVFFISLSILIFVSFHSIIKHNLHLDNKPLNYLTHSYLKENFSLIYKLLPLGVFMTFKLFWFIPLFAGYLLYKKKDYRTLFTIFLILFCDFVQLLFSSDTSRILCLGFPAIILSLIKLKENYSDCFFKKGLLIIVLISFIVPQYYIGQEFAIPFYPLPVSLILKHFGYVTAWY